MKCTCPSYNVLGYSRKKPNRGELRIYFSEKPPLEILDLWFYPYKFQRKQAFTPGNSPKFCNTPWKFQSQKPRPMEIPLEFFLEHPWKFCYFFHWPLEFPHFLSSVPLGIPCPHLKHSKLLPTNNWKQEGESVDYEIWCS